MKINHSISSRSHGGSATLVVLTMLVIMAMLVSANTYTTKWLRQEIKMTGQRQIQRLAPPATNGLSARHHPLAK